MVVLFVEGDMEIEIIGDLVLKFYIDIMFVMMKDFGVIVEN